MKKHLQPEDYLKKILTARVYDVAVETPLEPARALSRPRPLIFPLSCQHDLARR